MYFNFEIKNKTENEEDEMKKIMIVVSTLIILLIIAVSCGNKPAKEGETAEKKAESKSDVVTPISHVNTQISFSIYASGVKVFRMKQKKKRKR